jgi:hypothetical protein
VRVHKAIQLTILQGMSESKHPAPAIFSQTETFESHSPTPRRSVPQMSRPQQKNDEDSVAPLERHSRARLVVAVN